MFVSQRPEQLVVLYYYFAGCFTLTFAWEIMKLELRNRLHVLMFRCCCGQDAGLHKQ